MSKSKWIVLMGAVVLLGAAGCGSSSSGSSELSQIERDVSTLMEVTAFLLNQLPLPAPPAETGSFGMTCFEIPDYCMEPKGAISQCEVDGTYEITFSACTVASADGSVTIDGMLTYLSMRDWPSGQRDVLVTTTDERWAYDMTFDGTETVVVDVEDLIDGTQADCVGNLETFSADCELVVVQNPI
jgi:hypothetical protein